MPTLISPTDLAVMPFLAARRKRNRVSDRDRAFLAQWYVLQVQGGDRNPARTLADRYPESSFKTWANHFSKMRTGEQPLLTAARRRGVASGWLTDHAEDLLGNPGEVPEGLRDEYEATRDVYAPPVRRERHVKMPGFSKFKDTASYNRAYDAWAIAGEWFKETEVGPRTFEGFEDWVDRMREEESEAL